MAYIMGSVPYLKVFVRKEYLHNQKHGHGEYVEAIAYGVRCVRASSIWFQCALGSPYGGAQFLLPIEALCWKPCERPKDMKFVQPWDCFGSTFGVVEFDFLRRGAAFVLPDRREGQYRWTLDFTDTDLADDMEQHKHLHVVFLEPGYVGAFPNNRVLFPDDAFFPMAAEGLKWDLTSLTGEYRSEGNQEILSGHG